MEKPAEPVTALKPSSWVCRSVDEFVPIGKVNEGTYGIVYRATDTRTGKIVALKKIKLKKEQEGFPITSLREIYTLMKCRHPNVVEVEEVVLGDTMDQIFMVMEFVEYDLKGVLEEMSDTNKSFAQSEVKSLLYQILLAVDHMHSNWVLHRDLKAANLLISKDGILKVADFGMAREYEDPHGKYTTLVQTLWYRAPELMLGATEYTQAVDLWSVGCLFAELITKKVPFDGHTVLTQLAQIFKALGTPTAETWPEYPDLPVTKDLILKPEKGGRQLHTRFPLGSINSEGVKLMYRLLEFDPAKRITAKEALKHSYFKEGLMEQPYLAPASANTWVASGALADHELPSSPEPDML
eukprot:TRINITY_DN42131_c0_g1_i1.p1 TRINITY_DN42131_c0_g1~~TRINITY_DN42131_c0_g1_i1.p1  ORF type:complete len:353 (-),score=52.54 TRINITY_DN42131_c0_g1_i1:85-1143(-)